MAAPEPKCSLGEVQVLVMESANALVFTVHQILEIDCVVHQSVLSESVGSGLEMQPPTYEA